jgi:hypothetical protein
VGLNVLVRATVNALECTAEHNGTGGFWVQTGGSLRVINSKSDGDGVGCGAADPDSRLVAENVQVRPACMCVCARQPHACAPCMSARMQVFSAAAQGYLALRGGEMELTECVAGGCGSDGVAVVEASSTLLMSVGRVAHNTRYGVHVGNGGHGKLLEVESKGNGVAGYAVAGAESRLALVRCISDDDVAYERREGRLEALECVVRAGSDATAAPAWLGSIVGAK